MRPRPKAPKSSERGRSADVFHPEALRVPLRVLRQSLNHPGCDPSRRPQARRRIQQMGLPQPTDAGVEDALYSLQPGQQELPPLLPTDSPVLRPVHGLVIVELVEAELRMYLVDRALPVRLDLRR